METADLLGIDGVKPVLVDDPVNNRSPISAGETTAPVIDGVEEVCTWMTQVVGLPTYAPTLRQHQVDWAVLDDLIAHNELKELNMTAIHMARVRSRRREAQQGQQPGTGSQLPRQAQKPTPLPDPMPPKPLATVERETINLKVVNMAQDTKMSDSFPTILEKSQDISRQAWESFVARVNARLKKLRAGRLDYMLLASSQLLLPVIPFIKRYEKRQRKVKDVLASCCDMFQDEFPSSGFKLVYSKDTQMMHICRA